MKILLSAFSCSPVHGSEPGVGWNWVRQISKRHEVWVLMLGEYREHVERELTPKIHPVYVPSPRNYYRFVDLGIGVEWVYYYWWQWKAYLAAKKLHAKIGFDLAHHVTFASWRAPSFLCRLPVPLIWGPLGGGETIPRSLRSELSRKGRIFEMARDVCQAISRRDPFVRMTMRRAALIVTVNRDTRNILSPVGKKTARTLTTIGMSPAEKTEPVIVDKQDGELVVLFVARLDPHKGCGLAIQAFRRLVQSRANARLVIIGDGPERARIEGLVREEAPGPQRIRLLGRLPRPQVLGWMRAADIFIFPSLRDSGGLVLLEAMAEGKPVVCLDLGGPGEIVGEDCGLKIRPGSPDQVIADFAAALGRLAADPVLRQTLGEAGRRRVFAQFDWDKKGEEMMEIYQQVTTDAAK